MAEILESASGPGNEAMPPSSPELGATPETESTDSRPQSAAQRGNEAEPNGDQPTPEKRPESRYERTKRQRAEMNKRESALKQREEQLARMERERSAPKKPAYTLAELKEYREAWAKEAAEADWDDSKKELVQKADAEIKRLEGLEKQETQGRSFQQEWHQAEAELAEVDPEFGANKGTRLDKKLQAIMGGPDGQIYRQHPRGIVAAYHRAKMELLEGDHKIAQGRIRELETELKRLTGLTSIGGGAPGRLSNGNRVENLKDFSRLSSSDMAKHLRSQANKDGGTPWF